MIALREEFVGHDVVKHRTRKSFFISRRQALHHCFAKCLEELPPILRLRGNPIFGAFGHSYSLLR